MTDSKLKSLHERAMLVRHTIKRKQFRKLDREATHKIAADNGADLDEAGRFNKILIAREALADINQIASSAYQHHLSNTLPWDDQGSRLLPSDNYFDYTNKQRAYRERFDKAVGEFVKQYPAYIDEAKKRLNGMFHLSDYPDPSTIAEGFGMSVKIRPLPNVDDIRAGLPKAETDRIKKELKADLHAVIHAATTDLWKRLYDSVETMRDRLKEYSEDDNKRFFKSWTNNVREIAELVAKLNFDNDPKLEAARVKALNLVDSYDNEDLAKVNQMALSASVDADAILADMIGYIGG